MVAKWLHFKKPVSSGRFAIRGFADFKGSHGFENRFMQFFGEGFRSGFMPCDGNNVYWFFTWAPSSQGNLISHFNSYNLISANCLIVDSWL